MSEYFINLKALKYNSITHESTNIIKNYNTKFVDGWLTSINRLFQLHNHLYNDSNKTDTIYTSQLHKSHSNSVSINI